MIHGILPLLRLSPHSFAFNYGLLLNQLSRFCVPLFIFIAGLLLTHSGGLSRPGGHFQYIKRRARRVVIPYLVWTAFSLLQSGAWSFEHIWRTVFLGQGYYGHLYFVPLIMQFYCLAPWFQQKVDRPSGKSAVGWILALQAGMLIVYQGIYLGFFPISGRMVYEINRHIQPLFPIWAGYYALGALVGVKYRVCAEWVKGVSLRPVALGLGGATVTLLVDVAYSMRITGTPFSQATNFFRLSVFLYTLVFILFLFKLVWSKRYRQFGYGLSRQFLNLLGKHSFGVYLVHIVVLDLLKVTRLTSPLFTTWYGNTLAIVVCLLVSLGVSVGLAGMPWGWLLVGKSTVRHHQAGRPTIGA